MNQSMIAGQVYVGIALISVMASDPPERVWFWIGAGLALMAVGLFIYAGAEVIAKAIREGRVDKAPDGPGSGDLN